MLWQTKSGVKCEVDLDYNETFRSDGSNSSVLITVPWSQRASFLRDMLGYHKRVDVASGATPETKLLRFLPEQWVGVGASDGFATGLPQYCTSCELVSATGVNTPVPLTGTITNATNASPIVVTTDSAHGLTDTILPSVDGSLSNYYQNAISRGVITISGVSGNTAANGTWAFKVLSTTTLQLMGSSGNAAFSGNGTWTSDSYADSTKWIGFAKAKYRCLFQSLPYVIRSNQDIASETDERKRYVYRRQRFVSREMKVPGGGFKFDGTTTPLAEVGFRVSTEVEIQYTWYAVPVTAMPWTYIFDYTGHVNQASWSDNNQPSSNTYGAQTLLFKGVEEKRYFDTNGTMLVDLTYLFSFRGGTWNYFPDRNGVMRKIIDTTNSLVLYPDVIDGPTPAGGTRGVISLNTAGNVDFTKLFTPA